MDLVGEHAPLMSLRAVISAGSSNTQVFLPDGTLGPIHVVAGGGGTPAESLQRGVKGLGSEPALAPHFEGALDGLVETYAAAEEPPSQKVIDEALGAGSFDGYARVVAGGDIPTHGWWKMRLTGAGLELLWRARLPSGSLSDRARWSWTPDGGWQPK